MPMRALASGSLGSVRWGHLACARAAGPSVRSEILCEYLWCVGAVRPAAQRGVALARARVRCVPRRSAAIACLAACVWSARAVGVARPVLYWSRPGYLDL